MNKSDKKKVERLVEFVLDINEIEEDDPEKDEIYNKIKEIVENEIKI